MSQRFRTIYVEDVEELDCRVNTFCVDELRFNEEIIDYKMFNFKHGVIVLLLIKIYTSQLGVI